jgi:uncharacterized coiled-coil protein SlyX
MNSVLMRIKQRIEELERQVSDQQKRIEQLEAKKRAKRQRNTEHSKQREIGLD